MKCSCKIIILIIILTTLIVCALFIAQNLQLSPPTGQKLKALIGFKNTKKPYSNLAPSPSPSPTPSPSPSPSQAPPRLLHVHRQNHHHSLPLRPSLPSDDEESRLFVAVVILSACAATCMICLILPLLGLFKKLTTTSSSKHTRGDAIPDLPQVSSLKQGSYHQHPLNEPKEEDEAKQKVFTVRNILSNAENLDASSSVAQIKPDYESPSSSTTFLLETSGLNPALKLKASSCEIDETQNKFDEELIESLFSYNKHTTNEELKNKSPSPGKHVIEPKRLQNLTILLKALNATTEQVCSALVRGSGLNLQQLDILRKMEPTKEEEAKLTSYKGNLGSTETFVATILRVPYAFQRIQALFYQETFEYEVTQLRTTFLLLEEACKELRSSRLILKLLEAVLKMGNRMNVGAKAFKLDALLQLADEKGTDQKTTLLHFVVQDVVRSEGVRASESIIGLINQNHKRGNIQDRENDYRNMGLELVSGLSTELCNVKKSATIDFVVIASSISNLSQGFCRLQTLVNQDLNVGESMKSFCSYAGRHLKELREDEHKVMELVKQIAEDFHGRMSKDDENPLRIFVIVRDFLVMLDRVCRDLRRSKVFTQQNPVRGLSIG